MRNGLYISVLIIILLSGCKKENLIDGNPKAVNTNFTLVPAEFGSITTRAGVAVDENNVINLWILQFDGTTDASILVRSEYKASIGNLAELQIVLNQGVNHRVLFIANTFDSALFNEANAPLNTFTYLQFKQKTFSLSDESGMFTGGATKYLKMYGIYEGVVPNKNSSVILYRIGARVNLTYTSEDVSSVPDGTRFRITSVQLKNIPSTSSFISNPTNSVVFTPPSVIDYPITTGSQTGSSGQAYSIGDYSGNVSYYLPENIRGINSSVGSQHQKPVFAPEKSTWLEINGEGVSSDGRVNEFVVFKLYLGNNLTTNYNINTNTQYNISLKFKGVSLTDARLEVVRISDIEIVQEEEWI
ncbi:MAG: hypothetical protein A2X19_02080 [Bacteroidetes bacterium GWE2_39_28]|nr:MAG: hypothetical protein A2X19_02080 [Bacteroidetes bacterium GWE2_39_28]OFY12019.1 MAG: hypothetical protein A2X16_05710 [Bacteroidetes bacterium GWF2_39_10]OFZ07131.1 MAG: hypothetical protein A2322_02385 [Bacteroidetes bacterium RIFOXYB2_FULL_39_7]OFZ11274.1 MAG: hypothetical protein A2465_09060 [Bacteroidetes bacterium RIFOXYC2_FULL_39_11]HCT95123.1 hypothetical protein [Rikenellaceae bacterium]